MCSAMRTFHQGRDHEFTEPVAQLKRGKLMDQQVGRIESAFQAAGQECVRNLMVALIELKRGDCWCEMGIGNPNCRDHSRACKNARAVLLEARVLFGIPGGV